MQSASLRDLLAQFIPLHLFSTSRLDRELVADFFMLFARAEYALKCAKFIDKRERGHGFDVDWDKFARKLGDQVTNPRHPQILEAVRYLQEKPPGRQIYKHDRFEWVPRECTNRDDPVFVIRSVTTVRNNLFHGGKEIVGIMAERDRELLEHSLLALAYWVTLNDKVRDAFCELGPEAAVA
jgi:hypothetical protein